MRIITYVVTVWKHFLIQGRKIRSKVVEDKLKHCPFCGEMPIIKADGYMAHHPKNGCVIQMAYCSVKAWNTRTKRW